VHTVKVSPSAKPIDRTKTFTQWRKQQEHGQRSFPRPSQILLTLLNSWREDLVKFLSNPSSLGESKSCRDNIDEF
jgi:hypothetical protein